MALTFYTSHVIHQGFRFMIFKPENDMFVVIGKIVTQLIIVVHELQC
jgi:hypothetical protein